MRITFIIGGAKSGKSTFALQEASRIKGEKTFIATAEALDDEMKERIRRHRVERGSEWNTCEEPLNIVSVLLGIKDQCNAIVLDCLTIWLSNVLLRAQERESGLQGSAEDIQGFIDSLVSLNNDRPTTDDEGRLFIVSNEVGSGIVPDNKLARQFRDLAGTLNQKIAEIAREVYLVTAGIPVKIK